MLPRFPRGTACPRRASQTYSLHGADCTYVPTPLDLGSGIFICVEGKDLEEVILAQDPGFRKLIEERRRHEGPLVSHEALKAQAEWDLARERRGARPPRPARRRRAAKK